MLMYIGLNNENILLLCRVGGLKTPTALATLKDKTKIYYPMKKILDVFALKKIRHL